MVDGPKVPITRRLAAQPGMVAELDGEDLRVDRGRVDLAVGDQPDGALMEAGLHDAADEPGSGAHTDQLVEGDGVTGWEAGSLWAHERPCSSRMRMMRLSRWTITSE
jgi:hypothetical protein